MNSFRLINKCAFISLNNQIGNRKSLFIMGLTALMSCFVYFPLTRMCLAYHETIPPVAFVFYLSHYRMLVLHGGISIFMFSDILKTDEYTLWITARVGRKIYILGQILYVMLLAALFTVFQVILSLLMTFPVLHSFSQWGILLYSIGNHLPEMQAQTGITMQIVVSVEMLNSLTPFQALIYGIVYLWLNISFIGILILFFTVFLNRMTAMTVAGTLMVMTMFSMFAGIFMYSRILYKLTPLSWSNIALLDWQRGSELVSPEYAAGLLITCIIVMCLGAYISFVTSDREVS